MRFTDAEEHLHEAARARVGFSDFGDDDYIAPLRLILSLYDSEATFTPDGAVRARDLLVEVLAARLYAQQGWAARPDCLGTQIRQPLIITGIPRSGTTALHKLLSLDPQFQGLEHWLSRSPVVRPARALWDAHPLYQRALRALEDIFKDQPLLRQAHGQAAAEVDECYNLLMQSFVVSTFSTMGHVPSYDAWYFEQDETASYRRFRDNLKLIGAETPERRWLLKNPNHIFAIDALLAVFPDALIVQTHRNPVEAIPSVSSVGLAGRRYFEGAQSSAALMGARYKAQWQLAVARTMTARAEGRGTFADVIFGDFLAAPMQSVRDIYERFGLTLLPAVEKAMYQWLEMHPRGKDGEHHYRPEQFGLSAAGLRHDFREYIEAYRL